MIDLRGIDKLPSGAYRVRVQHRGEILTGTAPTQEIAVQIRDELKRQIVDNELLPTKGLTAKALGPTFLGSRGGNRDKDNDASRWHRHVATARWATLAIAAVSKGDGISWLKDLKRKRTEPPPNSDPKKRGGRRAERLGWQTRKHCLNLARRFFDWAIGEEKYGITVNPFTGLVVEKEDGDEDSGYQEGWYLDATEQGRFLSTWDDPNLDLDATDRAEKWIAAFAIGTGLRKNEQWCLHLTDLHVDGDKPHVLVRFGTWDPERKRYRAPKGRKGEKKTRKVDLWGPGLEAAKQWLAILPSYAPKNPLGLVFPTERGARREKDPRSWAKVVDAFGVIPRIGRPIWWHLLRHTCASSLVSGWWGIRWQLEDVSKVLGHTDVRTTQIYAHLTPDAVEETAKRAQAAYLGSCHGAVTAQRPAARKPLENKGHARQESNLRHSASKADRNGGSVDETALHDKAVTAIRHVLGDVASGAYSPPPAVVQGLGIALDDELEAYGRAATKPTSRPR